MTTRTLLSIVLATAAMVATLATPALAVRHGIILIDRTGSMQFIRSTGNTRCADAVSLATADINSFFSGNPSGSVAVWTFNGLGIVNATGGFVAKPAALAAVNDLDPEGCTDNTPLADAICSAADALVAAFPGSPAGDLRLYISSDGGENSSVGECAGTWSCNGPPSYDPGSWQARVLAKLESTMVVNVRFWGSLFVAPSIQAQAGDSPAGAQGCPVSDAEFFTHLATATSGQYTFMDDGSPGSEADGIMLSSHFGHECPAFAAHTPSASDHRGARHFETEGPGSAVGLPNPASCTVAPCLVACPAGDIPFSVVVRDVSSTPLPGATVLLDFSLCSAFPVCAAAAPYGVDESQRRVWLTTDGLGEASFPLRMGGTCASGLVKVYADGMLLGSRALASVDQDGDLIVAMSDVNLWQAKVGSNDPTGDFNCDGTVTGAAVAGVKDDLGRSRGPFALLGLWPSIARAGQAVTLEFQAASASELVAELFDIVGRRISHQDIGVIAAGRSRSTWQLPDGIPPGLYSARLSTAGGGLERRKLIIRQP